MPKEKSETNVEKLIDDVHKMELKDPCSPTDRSGGVFQRERRGHVEIKLEVAKMDAEKKFPAIARFAGFEWKMEAFKTGKEQDTVLSVVIHCQPLLPTTGWACNASFTIGLAVQDDTKESLASPTIEHTFKKAFANRVVHPILQWTEVIDAANGFTKEGFIVLKSDIVIRQTRNVRNRMVPSFGQRVPGHTDGCLSVDGEKFYISRTLLALHSPFFGNLFSDSFPDGGKEVNELHDVTTTELQDLLTVIYAPERLEKVNDLEGLLRVADMYEVDSVLSRCGSLLVQSTDRTLAARLRLASKYNLPEMYVIVAKIDKVLDIKSLEKAEEWEEITDAARGALLTRLFEIGI